MKREPQTGLPAAERRRFLKTSAGAAGGLLVAFHFGPALAQTAAAAKSMRKQDLQAWLALQPDGRVTVYSGKVDLGTGVKTALLQMTADELELPMARIDMVMGDTGSTIDQGQTAGSLSISVGGVQLRQACATARLALATAAAAQWQTNVADIGFDGEGRVFSRADRSRSAPYAELLKDGLQRLEVDPKAPLKAPGTHRHVGRSVARVDIPAKVTGEFTYIHDLRLPGMLHARVLRPAGIGAQLQAVDDSAAQRLPGYLRTVRKGNFLAVVATTEWSAVQAARALQPKWSDWAGLPPHDGMVAAWRGMKVVKTEPRPSRGDIDAGFAQAAKTLKASYDFNIQSHASLGPSCAVARFDAGQCQVWSASQSTHSLQGEIAALLGLPKEQVRLRYVDGSGCYGRNGHEDCSADAALVSQLLGGAAVRVQWSRADELGWDPKSPPTVVDLEAGIAADGSVSAWRSRFIIAAQTGTLDDYPLLAAVHSGVAKKGSYTGNIAHNSDVEYAFANTKTWVERVDNQFLRTSHLRTPGRLQNNFANESFLDEVAAATGRDPLALRLSLLSDPRSKAVLEAVAKAANWRPRTAATPAATAAAERSARGRGVAYIRYQNEHTYVALVTEVVVDRLSGAVRVERVFCAHDCGQVINPDGAVNQIEGGIVQTISRTLIEDVAFDASRVTSTDWASYPILKFPEVPTISTVLIDRPEAAPWGAGEMAPAVVPAAIGNAIFDAVGVRLRSAPFLPAKVLAGLAALKTAA